MNRLSARAGWFAFAIIVASGCASSGSTSGQPTGSDRDRISSREIDATPATSAYDLVSRLRPHWLRAGATGSISGGSISSQITLVYVDGNRLGSLDALRTMNSAGIRAMEWIDATRAPVILRGIGSEPINGVIAISTKQ